MSDGEEELSIFSTTKIETEKCIVTKIISFKYIQERLRSKSDLSPDRISPGMIRNVLAGLRVEKNKRTIVIDKLISQGLLVRENQRTFFVPPEPLD